MNRVARALGLRFLLALYAAAALWVAASAASSRAEWASGLRPAMTRLSSEPGQGASPSVAPPGLLDGLKAVDPEQAGRLDPVIEQLGQLGLEPASFRGLSPAEQDRALSLSIEAALSSAETRAEDLLGRAQWIETPGAADPGEVKAEIEKLLRRREFLGRGLRRRLERARSELRSRLQQERLSRIEAAENSAQEGLRLRFTKNFESDTKGFTAGDWRRLRGELDKVGPLASNLPVLAGEHGNVKFLRGGSLSGLSEFKFGVQRKDRVFFLVSPSSRELTLLRLIPRSKLEPGSPAHRDMGLWRDPVYLNSRLADASLSLPLQPIIPLSVHSANGRKAAQASYPSKRRGRHQSHPARRGKRPLSAGLRP